MINKQAFRWSAAACFAAWLALGAVPAVAAGMYKWTDDQGIVHYSDQMPADAVTLTPAQIKAKEAEDERLRLLAKAQENKSRRDIALTHSYTSEEEIDFARSRALLAIESQLKSAETYIADLTKRQQELKKDKLAFGTKPVPATLDTELTGLDEELARQDKVLAQRRAEIATINTKYESDKQRWREIRTDQGKPPAPAAANTPPAPPSKGSSATATK